MYVFFSFMGYIRLMVQKVMLIRKDQHIVGCFWDFFERISKSLGIPKFLCSYSKPFVYYVFIFTSKMSFCIAYHRSWPQIVLREFHVG